MSIRKKFILSNILAIVIPLLVGMIASVIFIDGPGAQYWETMGTIYKDSNGIYSVESIVRTYKSKKDIKRMKAEMGNAGYHFSININGETAYSDITDTDYKNAQKIAGDIMNEQYEFTLSKGSTSVIQVAYNEDDKMYRALAIHTKDIPAVKGNSYMKRYIVVYISVIVLFFVMTVIIVNAIVTRWTSKSVLVPLKKLSNASSMISEGNLDFHLAYDKDDEMGKAIEDFDEMRVYLKKSVDERLRYEELRKELMIGISHDLRTPLTSIKGYIEGLRDGIASSPEMKAKYYDAIETSTANLENLVDSLTNFSRLETGEEHLRFEPADLNVYYQKEAENLQQQMIKDNVKIETIPWKEPLTVLLDEKEMNRVNFNIIQNSIKYRKKDTSEIKITLKKEKNNCIIRIKDDGPGVKKEELKKIFNSFYRVDAVRTGAGRGNGIGLAVVKQIVENHWGSVKAENDNGLAIIMTIPLYKYEEE